MIHLAGDKQSEEIQLVVNLFQSVLDGFIRGEIKKGEAEPAKVKRCDSFNEFDSAFRQIHYLWSCVFQPAKSRKKRRKKDENVSLQVFSHFSFQTSNSI